MLICFLRPAGNPLAFLVASHCKSPRGRFASNFFGLMCCIIRFWYIGNRGPTGSGLMMAMALLIVLAYCAAGQMNRILPRVRDAAS